MGKRQFFKPPFSFLARDQDIIVYILIALIFIYTCVRAAVLSIAHDEALTFLIHASGSFHQIFTFALPIEANSHLLNTFLIKIFVMLFGNHEFVLRLPALIGHGLYLVAIYNLSKLFLNKYSLILGICLLILHPFILDFCSCARGYSFGLGFLVFSLYYSFKIFEDMDSLQTGNDNKYIVIILLMLTLAALSHLVFLKLFFSIMGVLILLEFKKTIVSIKQKHNLASLRPFIKVLLFFIGSVLFLALVYIKPIKKMLSLGEFSFGGVKGV